MLLVNLVLGLRSLGNRVDVGRGGRQAVCAQNTLNALLVPLEESGQATLLTLLLNLHQLLRTGLANLQNIILGGGCASNGKQADSIRLANGAQLGVAPPSVALPVGVVGNVTRWDGDGVIVRQRGQGPGSRKTELRVQRDTGRAIGIDGEELTETLPDSSGADGVFLLRTQFGPLIDLIRILAISSLTWERETTWDAD